MSIDVSPDGKTIVFDLLGDLYTIPIAGGTATRLTSGMAFNSQPRYSPDGRQLAFTSDRDGWVNVWVAASDGSAARQVTHARWSQDGSTLMSPEWTPDGEALVVSELVGRRRHGTRLTEYPLDGGAPRALTHLEPTESRARIEYRGAAFGTDARFVYAASRSGSDDAYWQITRIDRLSKTTRLETSPLSGLASMRPALSPDGRYLVFATPSGEGTGLRVRDRSTLREWWLVRHAQQSGAAYSWGDSRDLLPGSSFTPDSRALITTYGGKIWRVDVATGAATNIPFTVDINRPLGPLLRFDYPIRDDPLRLRAIRNPQISPDGARVVFTALDRLWIMNINQSAAARRLTKAQHGEFFPTWSPDGRHIAYVIWSDPGGGAVYRLRADGTGEPQRLTRQPAFYSKPVYTADGAEIITVQGEVTRVREATRTAERSTLGELQLVAVSASGVAVRTVAPYEVPRSRGAWYWKKPAFLYGQPHRSSQSDRISIYNEDHGLRSVRLDGSGMDVILESVVHEPAAWHSDKVLEVLRSPDGRHALVLTSGTKQLYLVEVDGHRGEPRLISLTDGRSNVPGMRVLQLTGMGVDFLGWIADGRPYYSIGNALFVAEQPVDGLDGPPTFRRITIDIEVPRDRGKGSLLLTGARLLTMRGREVIPRGDLLVRDGRIAAIGPAGTVAAAAGTKTIDVSGATILPGYIDVHEHVGTRIAFGVHEAEEPRLLVDLAHGVTTLRDPLGYGPDLMAYGERAEAGDLMAPRIFTVTEGIYSASFGDGGHQDLQQTRQVLRLWSEHYRSETIKQYMAGGRRTRQLIAMAAREQRLTPTNEGGRDTAADLTLALDGYGAKEHITLAAPQFEDVIGLFVRADVIPTPTVGVSLLWRAFLDRENLAADSKLRRFYPAAAMTFMDYDETRVHRPDDEATTRELAAPFAKIMAAGGCVAMGSHGNIPGVGSHYELWYLAMGGMPLYDVLRAGTMCGAIAIGHGQDLGSLEVGKLADIQILDQNPLDDIRHTRALRYVMVRGRLYEADTLNEIWPRKRALPRQLWWSGESDRR